MASRRYDWWQYAKSMIRKYPERKSRNLCGIEKLEFHCVEAAIEETQKKENAKERLTVIDCVFWKKSHTLCGAAMVAMCSERSARRYHTEFIKLVGKFRGLSE